MKRNLPFFIIGLVLIAAAVSLYALVRSSRSANSNTATPVADGPPGAVPSHVRGNPDAKVTLEEFGDFQCPSCGVYYAELRKIEEEFGPRLRVVFREYPLYPSHKYGLLAAQVAEAAGAQGRFWEMHDKLYETQKVWSDAPEALPIFTDYANAIGLDIDRFNRDINGEAVASRIMQDGIRAHALGVKGTPSFFINGKEVKDDLYSFSGLRTMINKELSGGQ